MSKEIYSKVTIEAAENGWVLTQKGKPARVFIRWESLISALTYELTSKGDKATIDSIIKGLKL